MKITIIHLQNGDKVKLYYLHNVLGNVFSQRI